MGILSIHYHAINATRAMRARQQVLWRGYSINNHPLWTVEEDGHCRALYPNYPALIKALPRRSRAAIKERCRKLGISKRRHRWTDAQISKLRMMYSSATWDEILQEFPFSNQSRIEAVAYFYKFRRPRRPYKPTGYPIIDCIRKRAFEHHYTMLDLDLICRSRKYFSTAKWSYGRIDAAVIGRAAKALGGKIEIEWDA